MSEGGLDDGREIVPAVFLGGFIKAPAGCSDSAPVQGFLDTIFVVAERQGGRTGAGEYKAHLLELPHDLYIPPEALEIFLDTFEGPLDLLLYLIRRQNLDILDIPLAEMLVWDPDEPMGGLTLQQIKDIYTGKIGNWKGVGGADQKIILYGRENNSGTYVYFKEHVLENEDFATRCQNLPGTASVVNAVPWA